MIIHEIKLVGKLELELPEEERIEPDIEYALMLDRMENKEGKTVKRIDEMGRIHYCYSFVPTGFGVIKAGDKVYKAKAKKTTPSQILRFKIQELHDQKYQDTDFERFYTERMSKLISQIESELA
jgi:hypothetical protein